jgi:endonuclease/exonuclease/phosphatase (EEP) superfamily protein YafD
MKRAIRFTLAIPPLVWGGIVNLFLIGNWFADGTRPIVLMNHLAPWITLISLIVFTLALILRAPRRLLVWLVPGVIAFAAWYGSAWLPRSAPDVDGVEITAMTFNVEGAWHDPERIVAVIREVNADIVGLEEAKGPLPAQLKSQLSDVYPYQATEVSGWYSVALISRFPFHDLEYQTIGADPARHLRAVMEIDGRQVVVYVIHPPAPAWNSRIKHWYDIPRYYDETRLQSHTAFAVDQIRRETLPVLVLCDCNTTPRSRQYRLLDGMLDEAFGARGSGFGFSHPVDPFPLVRIDYVWYNRDFAALDAEVWPDAGTSDHHPMWARLVLRRLHP